MKFSDVQFQEELESWANEIRSFGCDIVLDIVDNRDKKIHKLSTEDFLKDGFLEELISCVSERLLFRIKLPTGKAVVGKISSDLEVVTFSNYFDPISIRKVGETLNADLCLIISELLSLCQKYKNREGLVPDGKI